MDFLSFLHELEKNDLDIFTIQDAIKITDQSNTVVRTTLSRWVKEGKIIRLKQRYYSIRKIESKYLLQKLFTDTYIGLHSALEYYGTITQRFVNLDLITKQTLHKQKINETSIDFHKVKENLFFGFEKVTFNNSEIFISDIEKTIIDCIYFSSKVYLTDTFDFIRGIKKNMNQKLLKSYLNKINSSALNKRIGYLLELHGISIDGLHINNKYEKLNKNLSENGKKNRKWKLIVNENL